MVLRLLLLLGLRLRLWALVAMLYLILVVIRNFVPGTTSK